MSHERLAAAGSLLLLGQRLVRQPLPCRPAHHLDTPIPPRSSARRAVARHGTRNAAIAAAGPVGLPTGQDRITGQPKITGTRAHNAICRPNERHLTHYATSSVTS